MMRARAAALVLLALLAAAPAAGDEPNVETGKVEIYGPAGRLFSVSRAGRFYLLSRQFYAAEHGAGYTGKFRIVTTGPTPTDRTLEYETVCQSVRPGYRSLAVIDRAAATRDLYQVADPNDPATDQDLVRLFRAACEGRFGDFR